MIHNVLKINFVNSKDDKCSIKKTNCEISKKDVKDNQNQCNNCDCNCNNTINAINFRMNIIFILIVLSLIFMTILISILFFEVKHVEKEQYLEMSKKQQEQQALRTAQEELHFLKVQMQSVLQSTHENRIQISSRFAKRRLLHSSIKPFTYEFSNSLSNRYKRDADISTLKPHDKKVQFFPLAPNQTMNYRKNMQKQNNSTILNNIRISSGQFRSNLTVNLTEKAQNSPHDCNATFVLNSKPQNRKTSKDDTSGSERVMSALHLRRNQRKRKERENRESNKHRRNKKRSNYNRNHTRSGPMVATFIGEIPEQQSSHLVSIGPWIKRNQTNGQKFDFDKFYMVENNMAIEITLNGLYMIVTQIFYSGNAVNHSYWILMQSEGASKPQKLSICAVASAIAGVSCQTSVVTYLQKRDRLLIQQQENNRYINLRDGFSRVQLVLLREEKTT